MIIAISGSVGSGKTTIAKTLSEKLDYKLINLNELAKNYKIQDVKELQTFDFNLDKLLEDLELKLKNKEFGKNIILEGHFSHFINPNMTYGRMYFESRLKILNSKKQIIQAQFNLLTFCIICSTLYSCSN